MDETEQRIPIIDPNWTFYVYRRSDVELTEDDRPIGVTYRPEPEPRGRGIQGSAIRPTYLIIKELSEDWQISSSELHPDEVGGNPNHAVWECLCSCLFGGIVVTTAPRKRESSVD